MEAVENINNNTEKTGPEKNPEEYNFEEFTELEKGFIDLIMDLKDDIDKNTYDTLISDDVGGRLPTLALREVVEMRTNKAPDTFFLPFGRDTRQSYVEDQVKELAQKSGKTLLVSEYTMTGGTLREMVKVFDKAGLGVDVAVPFSAMNAEYLKEQLFVRNELGYKTALVDRIKSKFKHAGHNHKVFIGLKDTYTNPPDIDLNAQQLAGVYKMRYLESGQSKLHSLKKYRKSEGDAEEALSKIQANINKSREDVKLLARRSIEKVWGKKENEA